MSGVCRRARARNRNLNRSSRRRRRSQWPSKSCELAPDALKRCCFGRRQRRRRASRCRDLCLECSSSAYRRTGRCARACASFAAAAQRESASFARLSVRAPTSRLAIDVQSGSRWFGASRARARVFTLLRARVVWPLCGHCALIAKMQPRNKVSDFI